MHRDDPEFGYRLIADHLVEKGLAASERRVWRLCSSQRIWSVFGKAAYRGRRPGPPAHDDLVKRQFRAGEPNQLWLVDITEHHTGEGKLYLCAVKDAWSNRIVGYSIDSRMKASLAVAALRNAVQRRRPSPGCIVHSDRGSQFGSKAFRRELEAYRLAGSMGQVGSSADNAAMESFFALLQRNVLDRRRWASRDELRIAIVSWTERTYHRRRRQRRLGRLTPIEYETINAIPQVALAA